MPVKKTTGSGKPSKKPTAGQAKKDWFKGRETVDAHVQSLRDTNRQETFSLLVKLSQIRGNSLRNSFIYAKKNIRGMEVTALTPLKLELTVLRELRQKRKKKLSKQLGQRIHDLEQALRQAKPQKSEAGLDEFT